MFGVATSHATLEVRLGNGIDVNTMSHHPKLLLVAATRVNIVSSKADNNVTPSEASIGHCKIEVVHLCTSSFGHTIRSFYWSLQGHPFSTKQNAVRNRHFASGAIFRAGWQAGFDVGSRKRVPQTSPTAFRWLGWANIASWLAMRWERRYVIPSER